MPSPMNNENLEPTPRIIKGVFIPSLVAKAKLLLAVHEVEDIYIAYSEDSIERVVNDLKKHQQDINNRIGGKKNMTKFDLRKNFAISVNLLTNDIRNFANLYRAFRDVN